MAETENKKPSETDTKKTENKSDKPVKKPTVPKPKKVYEGEPIIKFDNVSKVYTLYRSSREQFAALFYQSKKLHKHKALDGISFEIHKGESVAIIGKNGAGKSTVLKMITGVAFPTDGTVSVKGRVAALLELTAGFAPDMTGRENIYFKGYVLGMKESEIKNIEPKVIEFADLGEYIDQPVRTYSSGMKMRLGFAININTEPDILVVDEALSVGDAAFKKKCKKRIKEMIKQDITVLYVSHSKDIADICDRAIYLQKGKIIFDGTMEETLKKYPEFAR
ncbi:MAG: ABC transporter ATP-binding protein [Clostridia bacterium]|nr:ABC transporter ATP-binding protein [Clostridia bacterium]